MKNNRVTIVLLAAALLFLAAGFAGALPVSAHSQTSADELAFRNDFRKLWEDHITWTRLYIVSAVEGLPDQEATAGRLLRNQDDIGDAIKPFYGEAAGDQLTALLRDHILIAAQLIDAAKAGDTATFEDAHTRWYENANEIAAFLHTANPKYWPQDEMEAMMKAHLDRTLEEAASRLNGDYATEIAAYDQVHEDILQMADMLSMGIIHQFPKAFK